MNSNWLHSNRFEVLLIALMMVIFNKIFFFSQGLYSQVVWPMNMVLLGLVSRGIFYESKVWFKTIKNMLFLVVVLVPFFSSTVFSTPVLTVPSLLAYLIFYSIIFIETMRLMVRPGEVTTSVIFGTVCGFLLLIVLATFSFLWMDYHHPNSLIHVQGQTIPEKYHQVTYFSSITLTTIGYGDITPANDNSRLLAAFWGVVGQFYMVAVVGIIISKFTSRITTE